LTQLPEQASQFGQLYTVFVFIADSCDLAWIWGLGCALCPPAPTPTTTSTATACPSLPVRLATPSACTTGHSLCLLTRQPPPSLPHSKTWLEALAQVRGTQGGLWDFFWGEEVLPKMDEEEEDAAALAAAAAAAAAVWHNQQLAQRKRRWVYRPPYEYIQHSFSLELMPPGRARIWLRFTPAEIYRLVPLLNLVGVVYRNRYTPDAITAFCMVCACLSFPSRWEHLTDLFGQSKSWLSTVFNDVILYLVARYREVLLWCPLLTYERL
jgi:hypothetical protein